MPESNRNRAITRIEADLKHQGYVQKTAPDGTSVWAATQQEPPTESVPVKKESIEDCIAAAQDSLHEAESRFEFWEEAKLIWDFKVSALLKVRFLLVNPEWIPLLGQIQATAGTFPVAPNAHCAIAPDKLAFLKRYHLIELDRGYDYTVYRTTLLGRKVWQDLPRFTTVAAV